MPRRDPGSPKEVEHRPELNDRDAAVRIALIVALGEKDAVGLPAAEDLGRREVDVSPDVRTCSGDGTPVHFGARSVEWRHFVLVEGIGARVERSADCTQVTLRNEPGEVGGFHSPWTGSFTDDS